MSALLRQLDEELALFSEFLDLLEEEAAALAGGRFTLLAGLTERKRDLTARIAACDAGRERLLVAMGHCADRAGADAAARSGGPALQQAWARTLAVAARAREQNHRVGVMVHAHLDFTRRSIAFLQTGSRPLYGPDGQHRAGGASGLRHALV